MSALRPESCEIAHGGESALPRAFAGSNHDRAFLYGITGAGLFRRLTYPGAPKYFVDPRPVEEILASGELGEKLTRLLREHPAKTPASPSPPQGRRGFNRKS